MRAHPGHPGHPEGGGGACRVWGALWGKDHESHSPVLNLTKTKRTQKLLKSLKRTGYSFKGKDFSNQNVKSILNNKFYMGVMT